MLLQQADLYVAVNWNVPEDPSSDYYVAFRTIRDLAETLRTNRPRSILRVDTSSSSDYRTTLFIRLGAPVLCRRTTIVTIEIVGGLKPRSWKYTAHIYMGQIPFESLVRFIQSATTIAILRARKNLV